LVLPTGEALGTLCVLDTVPRKLTDSQRAALKTLARSVVGEIELRRKMLLLEQEVARRAMAERHMALLAMRDPLTQLPNRTALLDRMNQELRHCARNNAKLAFMFLDLDRFKLINDTLGHDVGDHALMEVARRLTTKLRISDTVARLGGDEFALLLPNIEGIASAMEVAEQLKVALSEATILSGCRLHFEASIGVAIYPDHGDNVDEIMRHADLAMYKAKQI
jgi:diguanylate cyclase